MGIAPQTGFRVSQSKNFNTYRKVVPHYFICANCGDPVTEDDNEYFVSEVQVSPRRRVKVEHYLHKKCIAAWHATPAELSVISSKRSLLPKSES